MKKWIQLVLTLGLVFYVGQVLAQKHNIYWIEQQPAEDRKAKKVVMFRVTSGKQGATVHFKMKKNDVVQVRKDAEEQLIFILKGSVQAKVGDTVMVIKAGEAMLLPTKILHSLKSLENGTKGYFLLSPQKSDWIKG